MMYKKTMELRYDNLHFLLEPKIPMLNEMRQQSKFTCIDACLIRVGKDESDTKVYSDTFGIERQQILELMKSALKKYDSVIVHDMIINGSVRMTSDDMDNPRFEEYDGYGHTYFIREAYGFITDAEKAKEKAKMDAEDALYDSFYNIKEEPVDLDKEKWDNYYGDFNQCGIRIERY